MSKRQTNMAKNETTEPETETGDAPLIDLNDAAIKKLIARAKKRGIITYDEINEALPQDQNSSETDRGHHVPAVGDGRQCRRE